MLDEYSLTQEQVASRLGQERPTIGNLVRLLELPGEIQADVSRGTSVLRRHVIGASVGDTWLGGADVPRGTVVVATQNRQKKDR